jgi:transketolase
MRNIFVDECYNIAAQDKRLVFFMSECGFNVVEKFAAAYPGRFYNIGIAEQSLVGTAAGIASRGLRPVAYNMAMFLTMRAYEMIRDDVCYQNLPVVLAGVIPGLGYGNSGTTHHTVEDCAILRVLPNMTIVYPSCETDVRAAARQAVELGAPIYLGLARNGGYNAKYGYEDFKIGKAIQLTEGSDCAVLACGTMVQTAMQVAEKLKANGINMRVYNNHTVKPLDAEVIETAAKECGTLFTFEEQSIIGGLGGAVAEYIAESGLKCKFKRFGVADHYPENVGSYAYMIKQYGLDVDSVAANIQALIKEQKS